MMQPSIQPEAVRAGLARPSRIGFGLATATVVFSALVLYLVGSWSVSLWDRDEPWYAQTSRQMVQSGDWVVPHFLDTPRHAKPIFIYWCQAASMMLVGQNELGARLPSAVAMTTTLILLAIALRRVIGPRRAMYAVLVFATSAMVIVSAKMCLTDSVMLLWITGGMVCLFGLYRQRANRERHRGLAALFWVFVGLAGLTKGPFPVVTFVATLVMLAALDVGRNWGSAGAWGRAIGWWRRLRPIMGIGIVVAIVTPWLVMAFLRNRQFVINMFMEPVNHAGTDQGGGQVPSLASMHAVMIWVTFFPWSLFLPVALAYGWRHRKSAVVRFALASVLGTWLFAESMTTKLPHYMLPAYAGLAIMAGCAVAGWRGVGKGTRALVIIWATAGLGLSLIPWFSAVHFEIPKLAAAAFTCGGIAYVVFVLALIWWERIRLAAFAMGGGMIVLIGIAYGLYLPEAHFLRIPHQVGGRLQELGATESGQVVMTGYVEPSLAFYQGGTIRQRDDGWLAASDAQDWPRWIVVDADLLDGLPAQKREMLEEIAAYRGFNYNVPMKVVTVKIMRRRSE